MGAVAGTWTKRLCGEGDRPTGDRRYAFLSVDAASPQRPAEGTLREARLPPLSLSPPAALPPPASAPQRLDPTGARGLGAPLGYASSRPPGAQGSVEKGGERIWKVKGRRAASGRCREPQGAWPWEGVARTLHCVSGVAEGRVRVPGFVGSVVGVKAPVSECSTFPERGLGSGCEETWKPRGCACRTCSGQPSPDRAEAQAWPSALLGAVLMNLKAGWSVCPQHTQLADSGKAQDRVCPGLGAI